MTVFSVFSQIFAKISVISGTILADTSNTIHPHRWFGSRSLLEEPKSADPLLLGGETDRTGLFSLERTNQGSYNRSNELKIEENMYNLQP